MGFRYLLFQSTRPVMDVTVIWVFLAPILTRMTLGKTAGDFLELPGLFGITHNMS